MFNLQAALTYYDELDGVLHPQQTMEELAATLRDLLFPQGPPIEPVLIVNGVYWRAGDIFVRRGTIFLGGNLYGIVTSIRPDLYGLHAVGLAQDSRQILVIKPDLRIPAAVLALNTLANDRPVSVFRKL